MLVTGEVKRHPPAGLVMPGGTVEPGRLSLQVPTASAPWELTSVALTADRVGRLFIVKSPS